MLTCRVCIGLCGDVSHGDWLASRTRAQGTTLCTARRRSGRASGGGGPPLLDTRLPPSSSLPPSSVGWETNEQR
eukprot:897356-Prorocentrum_minimum.AAC.2